jgi:BMFP domain-containing protein YqiC
MVTRPDIASEISRAAHEALGALSGLKSEAESFAKAKLEKLLAEMKLVTQDEFDAVRAMAAKARTEQEALALRVRILEEKLGIAAPVEKPKPARRKTAKTDSKA